MKKVKFVVSGRVQGVFFRKYTQQKALSLGIVGEARNMPDGSVQVIAYASGHAIDKLENWLWQGSPMAKVSRVERHDDLPVETSDADKQTGFYTK